MKRVLFIQHGFEDGPGLFAKTMAECDVELSIVHPWKGETIPRDLEGFTGLALGGGSMSAYDADTLFHLNDEMALVRMARALRKPVLGMCLGAQLMASALGGIVFPNTRKEIGFFEIHFTPEAQDDPLWKGLTSPLLPAHWHGDTFRLPVGAKRLASSAITPNQLFVMDEILYGFQFHLEFDLPVVQQMIASDADYLKSHGVDPGLMLRNATLHLPAVEPVARTVFQRWTTLMRN